MLKFGMWVKGTLAMLVTQVMDGMPLSARSQVRTVFSRFLRTGLRIVLIV